MIALDGFSHTVHLDCGCRIRLNLLTNPCDIQQGYLLPCTTYGHSDQHYDQKADELIYETDREVVAVILESFDGVTNAKIPERTK